jgi:hypothetical protein
MGGGGGGGGGGVGNLKVLSEIKEALPPPTGKSEFPPLRATSCNVHYSGSILYDNERETSSKSSFSKAGYPTWLTKTFEATFLTVSNFEQPSPAICPMTQAVPNMQYAIMGRTEPPNLRANSVSCA